MHSKLASSSALGLFYLIPDLIHYGSSTPGRASAFSQIAGTTQSSAGEAFWFAERGRDDLKGLTKAIKRDPNKLSVSNSFDARKFFNKFTGKTKPPASFADIGVEDPETHLEKFQPNKLPHSDPSRIYFIEFMKCTQPHQQNFLVHQATFQLWSMIAPKFEDLERWLGFLKHAFIQGQSLRATQISVLYDLRSLRLKFYSKPDFTQKILIVEKPLVQALLSGENDIHGILWVQEMLFPQNGFSPTLNQHDTLKKLVQNDPLFRDAFSQKHVIRSVAFVQIANEFGESNTYRRLITLALYRLLRPFQIAIPCIQESFKIITAQPLFNHEVVLLKNIIGFQGLKRENLHEIG